MMPHVSVVIPGFNAAEFITEAYRSLVGQTTNDWEAIFINDASQDDTLAVMRSLAASDKRVKIINLPVNSGPAYARNAAVAIAEGDWIAVLDADDRFSSDRLKRLTDVGECNGADVVLDNQFVVDPILRRVLFTALEPSKGKITKLKLTDALRNAQSRTFFDFGYLKPVIRRRWLLANNTKYQEGLRLGEDLMFLFECFVRRANVILVSEPHYHYRCQYSPIIRQKSPTTRTEARYEPLLAATEGFLAEYHTKLSPLERRLVATVSEGLRETMLVGALKAGLTKRDIKQLVLCLCHPVRLVRGVYFTKRRGFLFRYYARTERGLRAVDHEP